MDQVENQGVSQEETQAQQEIAAPETEILQDQNSPKAEAQAIPNHAWAAMRKKNEELEKRLAMQEEILRYASQAQPMQQQIPQAEDILEEIQKEEYVPGEKVAKAIKTQRAEFDRKLQEIERRYQSVQDNTVLADLKRQRADFDEVVNPDTLALLKELDPRMANALEQTPDTYIRESARYDAIKARGLAGQVSGASRAKEIDKKLEQNKKVVQTPQVYDKRPMAKAFDYSRMDSKLKEELQAEMHHHAAKAHGVPQLG